MTASEGSVLGNTRVKATCLVVALLVVGLAIRLYDLTDLPLDFHPTRQLLSQLKARGMFYQAHPELPEWNRKMAIQQWKISAQVEPEVFERLVAYTYEFTGVDTSVARVYASIFWVTAGIFLFLLVKDYQAFDAAAVALAYFLFYPYAILASRSFQPDGLMVLLVIAFWWSYARWTRTESWAWAVLAGALGGLAIYVKFVAAFFVVGSALGLGLGTFGTRLLRKGQLWLLALLGALPAAAYLYYGLVQSGFLGRQFSGRFIPGLLLEPGNYLRWAANANLAAGGVAIGLGLLGLLFVRAGAWRSLLVGVWAAYIAYGIFFDYHIATHDYYHLPLVGLVALSLAPPVAWCMAQLARSASNPLPRLGVLAVFLYCIFSGLWEARTQLSAIDYRPQASMWSEIGEKLSHGPNVVALSEDYGSRLAYWGWQNSIAWPSSGDITYAEARGGSMDFDKVFDRITLGNSYFLVTDFAELARQPLLVERLRSCAVFAEGDGYVIYSLEQPVDHDAG